MTVEETTKSILLWLGLPADHMMTAEKFARLIAEKIEESECELRWWVPDDAARH